MNIIFYQKPFKRFKHQEAWGVSGDTRASCVERCLTLFTTVDRVPSGRIMKNVGNQPTHSSLIHRRRNLKPLLLIQGGLQM